MKRRGEKCSSCKNPFNSEAHRRCNESSKRRHQRRYEENKAEGLCGRCGDTLISQRHEDYCRKNMRTQSRRTFKKRENEGLCIGCGGVRDTDLKNCSKCRVRQRTYTALDKLAVFEYYGMECACCGEDADLAFLTIDHIDGNGREHKRQERIGDMYAWLIRKGFPGGFQTLCYNCNLGKYRNGNICPHQTKKNANEPNSDSRKCVPDSPSGAN